VHHFVFGLDVGLSVQQERHGGRLTVVSSRHQGRPTILQREEENMWSCIVRKMMRRRVEGDEQEMAQQL
jgi:hypothetical protein